MSSEKPWQPMQVSAVSNAVYTGYTQKDGAVSKVNKKYISC